MKDFWQVGLWVWVLGLGVAGLSAQVDVSGDTIAYEMEAGEEVAVFSGDARLEDGRLLLQADEIRYLQASRVVTAIGNVRLTNGSLRMLAERLEYRPETRSFSAENFRAGRYPYYLEGERLSGDVDAVDFEEVLARLGEPAAGSLGLRARRLSLNRNEKIAVEAPTALIGGTPVFYWPGASYDPQSTFLELDADAGHEEELGAFAQAEALFSLQPGLWIGPRLGYYTERGFLIGPGLRYSPSGAIPARGRLRSGYIHDQGELGFGSDGEAIGEDRYFLDWEHLGEPSETWQLTGRLGLLSDSQVTRDFFENYYEDNPEPDSFFQAVRSGENSALTLFARVRPNDFQSYPERLPELSYELFPTPLREGSPWLFGMQASYARLEYEQPNVAEMTSNRVHLGYTLDHPWTPRPWLSLTPTAGLYSTGYFDPTDGADDYWRLLGEIGFDAELLAHAQWDYANPVWNIDGLRHTLRPVLRYRYVPHADTGRSSIPAVDLPTSTYYPRPISPRNLRSLDRIEPLHLTRFGIENVLETRSARTGEVRQLARFDLYQDVLFDTGDGHDTWDRTYAELEFFPAHWLALELFSSLDTNSGTLDELNGRIRITSGDVWQVALRSAHLN
ncbi:MAG: LPS-assembly protein LptD, partial [Verrucomicrobiota bacterium]